MNRKMQVVTDEKGRKAIIIKPNYIRNILLYALFFVPALIWGFKYLAILAIVYIVFQIVLLVMTLINAPKMDTVVCFTGTLGAGKSLSAVHYSYRQWRKRIKWARYLRYVPIIGNKFEKIYYPKAKFYSNIPIFTVKKKKMTMITEVFTEEHMLGHEKLVEGSVVFIDEVGQFCSQWDFDNPKVMIDVQSFVRFFRHWTNGCLVLTDQSIDNIAKPIRCRIARYFELSDLHYPVLSSVVGVSYIETLVGSEDSQRSEFETEKKRWRYYLTKCNYDSRCFSETYHKGFTKIAPEKWTQAKTEYFPDMSVDKETMKKFKGEKRNMRFREDVEKEMKENV